MYSDIQLEIKWLDLTLSLPMTCTYKSWDGRVPRRIVTHAPCVTLLPLSSPEINSLEGSVTHTRE